MHVETSDGSVALAPVFGGQNQILAAQPYDFSCTEGTPLALTASVDSRLTSYGGETPIYGIFILPLVPPAADLWATYAPAIEMLADAPDYGWHTFPDTGSIANPLGPRFIIFAVKTVYDNPIGEGGPPATTSYYDYRNFYVDGPGEPCGPPGPGGPGRAYGGFGAEAY